MRDCCPGPMVSTGAAAGLCSPHPGLGPGLRRPDPPEHPVCITRAALALLSGDRRAQACGMAGQREQPQFAGALYGGGTVADLELGEDVVDVSVDGVQRDEQFAGDLRPGQVGRQVAQHPQLARAELPGGRRRIRAAGRGDEPCSTSRMSVRRAACPGGCGGRASSRSHVLVIANGRASRAVLARDSARSAAWFAARCSPSPRWASPASSRAATMVTYPMTGAVPSRTSRTARRAAADSRAAREQALAIDPVLRCPGLRRPNHCDPVTTFHLPGGKPESVPKARSPGESMEKNQFRLTVNGAERSVTCEPDTPLLDALRHDLGLAGPKFGCGTGLCGAWFVLIEGRARASCDL